MPLLFFSVLHLIQHKAKDELELFARFERTFNHFVVNDNYAKKQRLITDHLSVLIIDRFFYVGRFYEYRDWSYNTPPTRISK